MEHQDANQLRRCNAPQGRAHLWGVGQPFQPRTWAVHSGNCRGSGRGRTAAAAGQHLPCRAMLERRGSCWGTAGEGLADLKAWGGNTSCSTAHPTSHACLPRQCARAWRWAPAPSPCRPGSCGGLGWCSRWSANSGHSLMAQGRCAVQHCQLCTTARTPCKDHTRPLLHSPPAHQPHL